MSFPIEKVDLPPTWKGLYRRRQRTLNDPSYAEAAFNTEFHGGTLRTRGGSQIVNGWGTYSLAGWVDDNGSFQAEGPVSDASGFQVGDEVTIIYPDQTVRVFTVAAVVGNLLTFTTTTTGVPVPAQSVIYVTRGFGSGSIHIPGLHVAKFRDDALVMVAMGLRPSSGGFHPELHVVSRGEAPPVVVPGFGSPHVPRTTVAANWPSAISGFLTSVQGVQIGDRLGFGTFGPDTEERKVTGVSPLVNSVQVFPPLPLNPVAGQNVTLFPILTPEGPHNAVFAAFANWLYVVLNGYAPVKYGHVDKTTVEAGWSTLSGLVDDGVGFVTNDLALFAYPNGDQYLRTLSSVLGDAFVVNPALPTIPPVGTIVRNVKVFRVGIRPPTTRPTATATGTPGLVNGAHTFRIKFRSEHTQAESEGSLESFSVTATNEIVQLTNIPVSVDPQVTHKDIYVTTAGGGGLWYFAATIPNSQTTYNFNMADTALGELMRDLLDHTPADTLTCISAWPSAFRLIAIDSGDDLNPPRVVFSDGPDLRSGALRGDAWPADNFLLIGLDSGDDPMAIAPFFDSVFIFCERSIWRIRGTPPDLVIEPVNYRSDNTGIGTFGPRAVVVDQNECFFPGQDGFYLMNRYEGDSSGFQSQRISREIDQLWELVQANEASRRLLSEMHVTFFRQRREARCWIPLRGGSAPSELLVYHFDGDLDGAPFGWALWVLGNFTGSTPQIEQQVQASAIGVGQPDRYYVATRAGAILEMDINEGGANPGLVDYGGLRYDFEYATSLLAPGGYGLVARARMFDILWNAHGTVPLLRVTVLIDFAPTPIAILTITPPPAFPLERLDRLILLARGQYHQILLSNTTFNTMVEIQRMAYHVQRLPLPAVPETVVQAEPVH